LQLLLTQLTRVWLFEKVLQRMSSISFATLVFNDTPSNDFTSLSTTINAHLNELSQHGKLGINPLMVPKSHFQQVLPNDFVDAAFSFTALHWLQHAPSHGPNEGDNAAFAASAHDDLVAFLSARHRELRQDGTLTLCMPGQGPVGVQPVIECLEAAIRDLSSTYHFSPSVIACLPMYFRTMDEILSAVSMCPGAWNVLGSDMVPMVHSAWPGRSTETSPGMTGSDAYETYASAITGFAMAAISGFLVEDVKSNPDNQYPGDAKFLEEFRLVFRREFLDSFCQEEVGFTYAFVHLQKT
jgi:hypothetical protein